MVYQPKEIPEGVNVTAVHPLVNFAYLLGTVAVVSSVIYLGLGAIATALATRISPEMEAKIGQQLRPDLEQKASQINSQQRQYLNDLLKDLQTSDTSNYIPLTIYVHESPISNAAIFPGGHILITTTLLTEAESENELAFVLAHELGHHVARDHLKGMGRSLVFLTVASVLGIGSGNVNVVGITGSLTNLHYSRQQESAADVYALEAVVERYGHGDGSLDFFKRIQTEQRDSRGKVSSYFSTHPLTQNRIDRLYQIAVQNDWKMQGATTDLPDKIFEKLKKSQSNSKITQFETN